ncbi:MAG: type 1 glutamine amidotransferase [Acidobacteriota bacterium]
MARRDTRLLILRTGHTAPEVIRRYGDYDRWFTDRMTALGCRFSVRHLPDDGVGELRGQHGILVTGAASSVLRPEDWLRPLGELLVRSEDDGPPILAVCLGAQLAAAALGGRVERSARGWEIGTVRVDLSGEGRDDPLFDGLPDRLQVQATHEDRIVGLPRGAILLAANRNSRVQAFGVGRRLRAVQFHPEADAGIIRLLVQLRRARLKEEALRRGAPDEAAAGRAVDRIEARVRDSQDGRRILENWVRHFVSEAQKLQQR